jgi:hypothetical protein
MKKMRGMKKKCSMEIGRGVFMDNAELKKHGLERVYCSSTATRYFDLSDLKGRMQRVHMCPKHFHFFVMWGLTPYKGEEEG